MHGKQISKLISLLYEYLNVIIIHIYFFNIFTQINYLNKILNKEQDARRYFRGVFLDLEDKS